LHDSIVDRTAWCSNIPGGNMTTSSRLGLVALAMLALQVGCCSIQVDYQGPRCIQSPITSEHGCTGDACCPDTDCHINGVSHIGRSLSNLHSRATRSLRCGSGCGEIYWDEHINEPPVFDPCGCENQWTGGCRHVKPWFVRMRDLWGYPYISSDCSDGGHYGPCSDCGHRSFGGQCSHCGRGIHSDHVDSSETISSSESVIEVVPSSDSDRVPTPAKPPIAAPDGAVSGKNANLESAPAVEAMRPVKKLTVKQASGRRKLTTQTR